MAGRRTAVLISGSGSNLQALIDACEADRSAAEIALVLSNRADAFGLERARRHGIGVAVVDHRGFASRAAFEAALDAVLRQAGIELVCLAGFMRVLTPGFVDAWRNRLLNIHPSLLPAFPGLDTHARALRAGCRVHGCTVHLVRPTLDDGPILVQGVVPVLADDDVACLAARVLEVEHRCYPLALDMMARGAVRLEGDRVMLPEGFDPLVLHPLLAGQAFQP
jgi:phosphoribosylglycinamide formyltransferase 1